MTNYTPDEEEKEKEREEEREEEKEDSYSDRVRRRREDAWEDITDWWERDIRPLDRTGNLIDDKVLEPWRGITGAIGDSWEWTAQKVGGVASWTSETAQNIAARLNPAGWAIGIVREGLDQLGADLGVDPETEEFRRASDDMAEKIRRKVEQDFSPESVEEVLRETGKDSEEIEREAQEGLFGFADGILAEIQKLAKECLESEAKNQLQQEGNGGADPNDATTWRFSQEQIEQILDYQQEIEQSTCQNFYKNQTYSDQPSWISDVLSEETSKERARKNRAYKIQFGSPDMWEYVDIEKTLPTGFKNARLKEDGSVELGNPTGMPSANESNTGVGYDSPSYCPGVAEYALDEFEPNWDEIQHERERYTTQKPAGQEGNNFVIPSVLEEFLEEDYVVGTTPGEPRVKLCSDMRWEKMSTLTPDDFSLRSISLNETLSTVQSLMASGLGAPPSEPESTDSTSDTDTDSTHGRKKKNRPKNET